MAINKLPPLDLLRQLLRYDFESGDFYWIPRQPEMFTQGVRSNKHNCNIWNAKWAHKKAGSLQHGYVAISINGKTYLANRIAYSIYHNEQLSTKIEIDHINRIKSDNRIINLRKVTHEKNMKNQGKKSNNTSGQTGVHWHKINKKWVATIRPNNKFIYLGQYEKYDEAVKVRKNAELKYF